MEAGVGIGIVIAFLGGIVSFASPCCLPLVPAYVGYMVGTDTGLGSEAARRRAAFYQALAFVIGFSAVFVALWASVGLIGYVLRDYVGILRQLGGALLVFMGLSVAGVINVSALYREVRLPIGPMGGGTLAFGQAGPATPSYRRSTLLGVVFAAGWTPCIGPILSGIIGLASLRSDVAQGTVLLLAYALGLGIPFVLVALGADSLRQRLRWFARHDAAVSVVTGSMLVVVGFLMMTNLLVRLTQFFPTIPV